jgi:hypothetical protein
VRVGAAAVVVLVSLPAMAGDREYTMIKLGVPEGADTVIGSRLNNHMHVAGWSAFFDEDPYFRGWVWTVEDGFEFLPLPPGEERYRAIDISDAGAVAGDGGFSSGNAWLYEDGEFTIFQPVEGLNIGVMGGVNELGDAAGWFKDATVVTPDRAFLAESGAEPTILTPQFDARAIDVNDARQVAGYRNDLRAIRWSADGGFEFLGELGLTYSFSNRINASGHVVGYAKSANGNISSAWIYTDAGGQQLIPGVFETASVAVSINAHDEVLGITETVGANAPWLWTADEGVMELADLFDFGAENVNPLEVMDINDKGVILMRVFDNTVPGYAMVLLVPAAGCEADFNEDGSLDILDFVAFQDAFTSGDSNADCNDDGVLNILDFVCFQGVFEAGCDS